MGRRTVTPLTAEEEELARRMVRVRKRMNLQLRPFGQLFSCDASLVCKLEAGLVRITKERRTILEAIELALLRFPLSEVWVAADEVPFEDPADTHEQQPEHRTDRARSNQRRRESPAYKTWLRQLTIRRLARIFRCAVPEVAA